MANYHSDEWINARVEEHLEDARKHFAFDKIVGLFYQGSGNYGLDYEDSDVDTKLVVLPNLRDIVLNKKAVSTTFIRENDEHIDFKDLRLMLNCFRKQNMNFLEILFTDYCWLNPVYKEEWNKLVAAREAIARMDIKTNVKAMRGVAMEKFHALERPYPSQAAAIAKWGYSFKQLHHLLRVEDFMGRYIKGNESYAECIRPKDAEYLIDVKKGCYNLERARAVAADAIANIERYYNDIRDIDITVNKEVNELLDDVAYQIFKYRLTNWGVD